VVQGTRHRVPCFFQGSLLTVGSLFPVILSGRVEFCARFAPCHFSKGPFAATGAVRSSFASDESEKSGGRTHP
jgi:hypothetical protein